jgi:hypothetical protein
VGLEDNNIGAQGARALTAALDNNANATLTTLKLFNDNIGAQGARALAAALDNNATLKGLGLHYNNIGAQQKARARSRRSWTTTRRSRSSI